MRLANALLILTLTALAPSGLTQDANTGLSGARFVYQTPVSGPGAYEQCEDECGFGAGEILKHELVREVSDATKTLFFDLPFVGNDFESAWAAFRRHLEDIGREDLADQFAGEIPSLETSDGALLIDHEGTVTSRCGSVAYRFKEWVGRIGDGFASNYTIQMIGDCNCRRVGSGRIRSFEINLSGRRNVFENRGTYVLDPVVVTGFRRCEATVDCDCPEDAIPLELPQDADAPVQDPSFQTVDVTVGPLPIASALDEAMAADNCRSPAGPCDESARNIARSLLSLVQNSLPQDVVFSTSNRFSAVPGEDLLPDVRRFIEAQSPQSLNMAGPLISDCQTAEYELSIGYTGTGLSMGVYVHAKGCPCEAGTSDTESVHASFSVPIEVLIVQVSEFEAAVSFSLGQSTCELEYACCGSDVADAFPWAGFEFLWDTTSHCTFGGGFHPLTQFAGSGQTPFPSPLIPTPSTTTLTPPTTTEPGQSSQNPDEGEMVTESPPQGGSLMPGIEESDGNSSPCPYEESPECDYDAPLEFDLPCSGAACEEFVSTSENETTTVTEEDADTPKPETVTGYTPKNFKATTSALATGGTAVAAQAVVSFTFDQDVGPNKGPDIASDQGAIKGEFAADGTLTMMLPDAVAALLPDETEISVYETTGTVLSFESAADAAASIGDELKPYAGTPFAIADGTFVPVSIPTPLLTGAVLEAYEQAVQQAVFSEADVCIVQEPLANPHFTSSSTWGQPFADQWAIHRVGFTPDSQSAWDHFTPVAEEPVVVAVIDTGLDWDHLEIDWNNLWQNTDEIFGNGIDDDNNGFIDDTIGWDFWDDNRSPWDVAGHGTFVAGVMFADPHNNQGIAGISRHARLMPLKAMNGFGHTRASAVARAILYAADNGASVINLSLGGPTQSELLRRAVEYAYSKDVVIILAAGNEASPTADRALTRLPNVITVAASSFDDSRSVYSNYGAEIDVAAPGDDVLSLRARRTDILHALPGVEYEPESAFVGEDRRYYRASGTSFAAPIVSGVAALIRAQNPQLTAEQVMRILRQSARDVGAPGVDHFTGYGIVDAVAALSADPEFFITPRIDNALVSNAGGQQGLDVIGTAAADRFKSYEISIGQSNQPATWEVVHRSRQAVHSSRLALIPARKFAGARQWTIRLTVEHKNGERREFRFLLNLG